MEWMTRELSQNPKLIIGIVFVYLLGNTVKTTIYCLVISKMLTKV